MENNVNNNSQKPRSSIVLTGLPDRPLSIEIAKKLLTSDDPDLKLANFALVDKPSIGSIKIAGHSIDLEYDPFARLPGGMIVIDDSVADMVLSNLAQRLSYQQPMVLTNNGGQTQKINEMLDQDFREYNVFLNKVLKAKAQPIMLSNDAVFVEKIVKNQSIVRGSSMSFYTGAVLSLMADVVSACDGFRIFSSDDKLEIKESHPANGSHTSSVVNEMLGYLGRLGMSHCNIKQMKVHLQESDLRLSNKFASYYLKFSSANTKSRGLRDIRIILEDAIKNSPNLSDLPIFESKDKYNLIRQSLDECIQICVHRPTSGPRKDSDDFVFYIIINGYGADVSGALACARFLHQNLNYHGPIGVFNITAVARFNRRQNGQSITF